MIGSDLIGRVGDGLLTTEVTGLNSDLLIRKEEIELWVFLIVGIGSIFGVVLFEF